MDDSWAISKRAGWSAFPAPNYVNPQTRGDALLITSCILVVISFLVLVLRLYCRLIYVYNPGFDDVLMTFGFVILLAKTIFTDLAYYVYSGDLHVWDMPPQHALMNGILGWAAKILYFVGAWAVKASILWFYRRIYSSFRIRYVIDAVQIINLLSLISSLIVIVLECKPLKFTWQRYNRSIHGTCISPYAWNLAFGVISSALDIAILLLPMKIVYTLRAPLSQKLQVSVVFGVGSIACIASGFRIYYAIYLAKHGIDWNWSAYQLSIWAAVETNIGIICGSVPACKILLKSRQKALAESNPMRYGKQRLFSEDQTTKASNYEDMKLSFHDAL